MAIKRSRSLAFISLCLCYSIALGTTFAPSSFAASKWDQLKKAGDAAYEAGNYQKAEEQFVAAAKEAEKFEDSDKRKSTTIYNLGLVLQTEEKFDQSLETYKQAIPLLGKSFGEEHEKVAMAYNNIAEVLKMKDDLKGAEENHLKALAIYEKAYGDNNPEMAAALDTVADFYAEQEDYPKAEPLYRRSLEISKKLIGAEKIETAKRMSHLAEFFCVQGKYQPAQPLFASALKITEDVTGKESADTGKICYNFGGLFYDQSQFGSAEKYFKRAIEISKKLSPNEVPMMEASLGDVLDMQGKHAEADTIYKGALAKLEGGDPMMLVACLKNYQKHLNMTNKKTEAKEVGARIKEIKAKAAAAGG